MAYFYFNVRTLVTYDLVYLAGPNGCITGENPQSVPYGSNGSAVTAIPNAGYHFVDWSDGSTENPRTDANVTDDITVTANFAINQTYSLTVVNGDGSGPVREGASRVIEASHPPACYHFDKWTSADGGVFADTRSSSTTYTMPGNDAVVTATFAKNILAIDIDTSLISEKGGVAVGTVVRNSGTNGDLTVELTSDDTTEAVVPVTITIPNGSDSAEFTITAVDDNVVDGTRHVNIVAAAVDHLSATAGIDVTDNEKITCGSIITLDASEIPDMGDPEFTRAPSVYGRYTDTVTNPDRPRDMKATARGVTRIGPTSQSNKFKCEWSRSVYLYNRRARMNANRAGDTTAEWMDSLPGHAISPLDVALWAKATNLNRDRIDAFFRGVRIVPPKITGVSRWDGGDLASGVHAGSVIVIKGAYFGSKAPTVTLEYPDSKGAMKQQRLKVLKPYKYADYRGNAGRSCMDIDSATGVSEITVEMPQRWPQDVGPGDYDLVLDNRVGLTTCGITIADTSSNTAPHAENDDNGTLIYGGSYYIDVLANDSDADADKVTVKLEDRTSTKGGRVSVSRGKVRYTPPRDATPDFTDTFQYHLEDSSGTDSGDPATVTIHMNGITLDPPKNWNGTALGTVQPGGRIVLSGANFGVRAPTVSLAYTDARGNAKTLKLKVVSQARYADSNGRANRSYTCLDPDSADFAKSEITVELPSRAWSGYANNKAYTITVSNRFDTTGANVTVTTSDGTNQAPTANDDTVDIHSGEKVYYIDVLANKASDGVSFSADGVDADPESDKMTIILSDRTSNLGARISVDRRTNTVRYIRAKDELCPFTDWFRYTIKDASGAESNEVRVDITGHLTP